MAKHTKPVTLSGILRHVYLILLAIVSVFPLVWILLSSVKPRGEITGSPTAIIPSGITFEYYKHVIQALGFDRNIVNSVMVSLVTTLISIVVSSLAAYGIVRFFPRVGRAMTRLLIMTYMFPPILLAVPYSIVIGQIGLGNNRLGLIIVYLSFSIPFAVWLLVGFFQTVPIDIEEAARVDGANKMTIFVRIVLPLVMPGIVATAIYTFINAWNEFLYALILINNTSRMPVSVALKSLQGAEILDWGDMMAASALVVIPSIIFFMIIQKRIAGGLAEGAVK